MTVSPAYKFSTVRSGRRKATKWSSGPFRATNAPSLGEGQRFREALDALVDAMRRARNASASNR